MTQNLHCFAEQNYMENFKRIAHFIVENEIDVACFQEVAQPVDAPFVNEAMRLRQGNAALLICEEIKRLSGVDYNAVYSFAHYYYGTDEEGVAIISRLPIESYQEHLISKEKEIVMERRTAIEIHLENGVSITSVHLGIEKNVNLQSPALAQFLNLRTMTTGDVQLYFGDYNIPDTTDGYDGIIESGCIDLFGDDRGNQDLLTTPGAIDGWRNDKGAKRLDYGFANQAICVNEARVIFDGKSEPMVSDHFGLYFDLTL